MFICLKCKHHGRSPITLLISEYYNSDQSSTEYFYFIFTIKFPHKVIKITTVHSLKCIIMIVHSPIFIIMIVYTPIFIVMKNYSPTISTPIKLISYLFFCFHQFKLYDAFSENNLSIILLSIH